MNYQEYKEEKERLSNQAAELIKSYFNQLFQDQHDLVAIKWNQYIPSFNDGEPCTFSLGDVYICDTQPSDDYPDDYDNEYYFKFNDKYYSVGTIYEDKYYKKTEYKWFADLEEFLKDMKPEVEKLFGSNATVIVFRDSIEIEEFDCGY